MKWASALAEGTDFDTVVRALGDDLAAGLGGAVPQLVVLFASTAYTARFQRLVDLLSDRFPGAHVFGASASGVAGNGREVEGVPALAALAGVLPNVQLVPIRFDLGEVPDPDAPQALRDALGLEPEHAPAFFVLADPFTSDTDRLVRALDAAYPGCAKVGGLASGGRRPGANALFSGRAVYRQGAVALGLYGDIAVDAVVSQGARPVGPLLTVTAAQGNLVSSFDDRPAIEVLEEAFASLTSGERALLKQSPLFALAIDAARPHRGDFLVRNMAGVNRASGLVGLGFGVSPGDVVQLHVRDATTATEDLTELLGRHRRDGALPAAALLFSCLGRGERFFGQPDHETGVFATVFPEARLAGFFGSGEIGPVRGRTFVHAYTSAFALVRGKVWE